MQLFLLYLFLVSNVIIIWFFLKSGRIYPSYLILNGDSAVLSVVETQKGPMVLSLSVQGCETVMRSSVTTARAHAAAAWPDSRFLRGVNSFDGLNVTVEENNAKLIVGFNGNLLKGEGAMQRKKCKGVYQK